MRVLKPNVNGWILRENECMFTQHFAYIDVILTEQTDRHEGE